MFPRRGKAIEALFVLLTGWLCQSPPAAEFRNLGFDAADTSNVVDVGGGGSPVLAGSVTDLLPGWSLFAGTTEVGTIGLNLAPTGAGIASVYDSTFPGIFLEDRFSIGLIAGSSPETGAFMAYELAQAGQIPPEAQSLRFKSFGSSDFEVRVNDAPVSLFYEPVNGAGADGVRDGWADLRGLSGSEVTIRFVTRSDGFAGLDSVMFSPRIVPEPGMVQLCVLGAVLLIWLGRKRGRRQAGAP